MNPRSLTIFKNLLESIVLLEASSTLDLVQDNFSAVRLVKLVHQQHGLPDNVKWTPVEPRTDVAALDWPAIDRKIWYLIQADHGTALLELRSGEYRSDMIVFYLEDSSPKIMKAAMGSAKLNDMIQYLENSLGTLRKFYQGPVDPEWQSKRSERLGRRYQDVPSFVKIVPMTNDLLHRLKPLWVSIYQQAIADVKGVVANLLKHDAHERLREKLAILERLQHDLDDIEQGHSSDKLKRGLNNSVVLTAAHFFPEDTGAFTHAHSSASLSSAKQDGVFKVLDGIEKNDRRLLSSVLAYLKKELLKS